MNPSQQILGISFFDGTAAEAVEQMSRRGGVMVVPAAPAMVRLRYDEVYREAMVGADLAIPDLWHQDAFFTIAGAEFLKGSRHSNCGRRHGTLSIAKTGLGARSSPRRVRPLANWELEANAQRSTSNVQ